jgi:CheY-like chemotaxis protein
VRLPLAAPPADVAARPPAPTAAAAARRGERLLLADDDDHVRGTVRRLLLRAGWEVDEARDGQEALVRIAAAAPGTYAAAIFDVRMPILSGPEAARRLPALAPGLPVLLVSGYAEGAESLEGVLMKPFTGAALGRRVRELIDGAPAGR